MRSIIFSTLFWTCLSLTGRSQVLIDTLDVGLRDSLSLQQIRDISVIGDTAYIALELGFWSDIGITAGIAIGLSWNKESGAVLDSAIVTDIAKKGLDFIQEVYRNRNRDSSNQHCVFQFFGVRRGTGLIPTDEFQVLARYYFHVPRWSKFSSFRADTLKFSPGTEYGAMAYTSNPQFVYHRYVPHWSGHLVIHDPDRPCCVNIMGNIDGEDGVDIGDQTLLIDHLFGTCVALTCVDAANVDGSADSSVDMADLIALTEHLFMGGQLAECR